MISTPGPTRSRRRLTVGLFAVGLAGLLSCSSDGTVTVENKAPTAVTVAFGDVDLGEVDPGGGAAVPTDDCLQGPIVVTFKSGNVVKLSGRACPGKRLVVRDETAELVPQSAG